MCYKCKEAAGNDKLTRHVMHDDPIFGLVC